MGIKIRSCDQCPIKRKHSEQYDDELREIDHQLYLGRVARRKLDSHDSYNLPLDELSTLWEKRNAKAGLNARRKEIEQELSERCVAACPIEFAR